MPRFPILLALLAAAGCASPRMAQRGAAPAMPAAEQPAPAATPVTILVSIDGFRPDYLDRGVTPHLSALAGAGVRAAMRPSFPSKTFPNHWTLVTGLVPDRTGITSNNMEDPARPGEKFTMATDDPFWWNAAEPIWVAAERAGIRTATVFWPGANVAWGGRIVRDPWKRVDGGTRPATWQQYGEAVTSAQRTDAVIDLLRRPAAVRPQFLTLYFDIVDTAGHHYGPASPQVTAAVAEVDRAVGHLVDGLHALGQPANLVIVADHGMAATAPERSVPAESLADPADYRLFEAGPFASFYPVPGHEAALERRLLAPHAHVQCWRKAEIPARFRYGANPRVPPYFCLAETGWEVTKPGDGEENRGDHGYDNRAPEMQALFLANGPAFASGSRLPTFDNPDVYPLLRDLLGLPPRSGVDGTDAPFRDVLRR